MNANLTQLPKYLQWLLGVIEVFVGLGMVIGLVLVTFGAKALVTADDGGGQIEISLDVGLIEFELPEDAYAITSNDLEAEGFVLEDAVGQVAVVNPHNVDGFFDAFRVPMGVLVLFGCGMVLAILEFLRRFFRSVRQGESFLPSTVANLHKIGFLIIALELGTTFLTAWVNTEISEYMERTLTVEGIATEFTVPSEGPLSIGWGTRETRFRLNVPGILVGLMVLAIGEAFRQGAVMREENALTV